MGPTALPILWAQATGSSPGPGSLAPLALRRWFASLTLSSPEPVPSFSGLWWGLAGLAALLVVAIVLQGPVRALGQLFDLPGHVRLVSQALGRLRRSSRVVVVTIGATVLAWTASQTASYNRPQGKDDLILLTKSRSLGDLAVEGGIMAGLTPLRDVAGLGDNLPLLVAATILAFQATSRRWGGPDALPAGRPRASSGVGTHRLREHRAVCPVPDHLAADGDRRPPPGGVRPPEAEALVIPLVVAIPLLMALADGLVLAWILAELREARPGGAGDAPFDLWTCGGADARGGPGLRGGAAGPLRGHGRPARLEHLPPSALDGPLGAYVRWQLGAGPDRPASGRADDPRPGRRGLPGAAGPSSAPSSATSACSRPRPGTSSPRSPWRASRPGSSRRSPTRSSWRCPPQTWVLAAADSYSHYATLPIGLLTLAALVELGERAASTVKRAGVGGTTAPRRPPRPPPRRQ